MHCFLTNESPYRSIMLTPLMSKLPVPTVANMYRPHSQTSTTPSSEILQSPESSEYSSSTLATTVSEISKANRSLQVLLAIRLEDDYFIDDDEDDGKKLRTWCDWLKNIPEGAENITIQGVYKSCSALIILSLPIALWDLLPNEAAYSFIGFADSKNLANIIDKPDPVPETAMSYLKSGQPTTAISVADNEAPVTFRDSIGRRSSIDSAISLLSLPGKNSHPNSQDIYSGGSPDIANLIQAAGSSEAVIKEFLKEKHNQAAQNSQLWRLVDEQRTMILGLNKDLERALKDKDRYRKKLKEGLAQISASVDSTQGAAASDARSMISKTEMLEAPKAVNVEAIVFPTAPRSTSSNYVTVTAGLRSNDPRNKMLEDLGYYTQQSSFEP